MNNKRFIPLKRTAIDGKTWWATWDCKENKWASFYKLYGYFKTKKVCQWHIDYTIKTLYNNDSKMLYC